MQWQLPEYLCPFCRMSVTLIPKPGKRTDLNECSTCHRIVSLQPDGVLAVPLPGRLSFRREPGAFEVAIEHQYLTFGLGDAAVRYRVEADAVAWSAPTFFDTVTTRPLDLLPRFRFGATRYQRVARRHVRRVDFRLFELGPRGTNMHSQWWDLVFVAHDATELPSGHRLYLAEVAGFTLTRLLDWALEGGVPAAGAGGGYRGASAEAPPPFRVVDRRGTAMTLT